MPNKNYYDFTQDLLYRGTEQAVKKHITPEFRQFNDQLSDYLVQTKKSLDLEQAQIRQRNLDFNPIKAVSNLAGESDVYASTLYNRINNISNLGFEEGSAELKSITEELNNLQEKATTNQFGGVDYLADIASGLREYVAQPVMKGFNALFGNSNKQYDLNQYLENTTPDIDALKAYANPDLLKTNYIDKLVDRQRELLKLPKLVENYGGVDKILNEIETTQKNPNRKNAFDNLALSTAKLDFITPGSDLYRDPESTIGASVMDTWFADSSLINSKSAQYVKDFQDNITAKIKSDPTESFWNGDNFLKYDLEKKAISQRKLILQKELENTLELAQQENPTGTKAKENPIYKNKIDRLNNGLNTLVDREKELEDSLYGVKTGDRMGKWRALGYGLEGGIRGAVKFFGKGLAAGVDPSGSFDADINLFEDIGGYRPEVIAYDKYNNPVLSTQVFYETAAGSKENWDGFTESGFKIVGEMLPTIFLTRGLGGALTRAAGAEAAAVEAGTAATTGWATKGLALSEKVNKFGVLPKSVPVVGGPLRLADRALTMASVYPTVYEKIYQQELKWGGNASARARALALNEALTEAIGFPEVGGLALRGYQRGLGAAARTATDIPLTRSQRYMNFMRGGAEVIKNSLKVNFLESLEEEMALFGEYLIAKGYEEDYDKVDREKPELTGSAIVDTFVEAFKGGLIYSGLNTAMRHYQLTRPDALRDYARYEAAQNPELFKAKLVADFKKNPGKMTQKDLQNGLIEIDNLSTLFKSLSSLDNLKDLNTFLDDEDSRFRLFTQADYRNTLINFDYESLTDEQKEELSQYKLMSAIAGKGEKKLAQLKTRTAELSEKATKEELTAEEKKELTESQLEYMLLKPLSRYKYLNKRDLTNQQIKYLTDQGIIQENDFQFTKQDLDKMISEVDTEILKTEKRAFQYASLTESQKREKIREIYDQKIEVVNQMTNPSAINKSLTAITQDYEYLDKNVNGLNEEIMAHKKRLLDAYRTRLDQLTTPTENGMTAFENELSEVSFEDILNTNSIDALANLSERLEENKDFVDQGLSSVLNESMDLVYSSIINNLSKLQGQAKLDALLPIFDKLVKKNPAYFYEIGRLTTLLSPTQNLKVDITPEEFETLRDNLMELRGKRRSQSIAETGRYDNVDTPVEGSKTEVVPEEEDLNKIVRTIKTANTDVDESGKSEKSESEQQYIDRITTGKTPAQVVQIIKNLLKNRFNENSTIARNIRAAIDQYTQDRDKATFDLAMRNIEAGIEKEIANLELTNPKSKRIETLKESLDHIAMWKKTLDKLVKNKANTFDSTTSTNTPGKSTTSTKTGQDQAPPGVKGTLSNDDADQVLFNADDKALLESLDSAELARRQRLLELTSSLRTAAVEVSENNTRNTDPVVQRRVRQLESLSTQPIVYTKIMNRRQFVREAIAARFPDKKFQDIENDLALINSVFENNNLTEQDWDNMTEEQKDTFLEPVNQLLGKNFFDNYDLKKFVLGKGKGLITMPNVIVAIADEQNKLAFIEGYPAEFNFTAETTPESRKNDKLYPNVPWRISQRVTDSGKKLALSEADVLAEHRQGFEDRQNLIKYLQDKDESIPVTAEITEGVLIGTKDNQLLADIPTFDLPNPLRIEDFMLAENLNNAIFGKNYKFSLGRLYYNNKGNPLILGNVNITQEDAETLADLVFSTDDSLVSPAELKDYLYTIINQIGEERLLFFEGDTFARYDDNQNMVVTYSQLVNPVKKIGKDKGKKLTKEEFIKELTGRFYKVDRKYLTDGERAGEKLLSFRREQQPDGSFKIVRSKEPYLEYLKRTHTFPLNSSGELNSLVNKTLYLNKDEVSKGVKAKKLTPPTPVSTPSKTQKSPNNPANWKVGDEIVISISARRNTEYKTKIVSINTDGEFTTIQYKDSSGNLQTIDNVNSEGVFEQPYDADNGILRTVSLAPRKGTQQPSQQTSTTSVQTTSTQSQLTPKVLDSFSILPVNDLPTIGIPIPPNEANYTAALAVLKMNPSNLQSVEVLTKDAENNIKLEEYIPGVKVPNTIGFVLKVKVGEKVVAVGANSDVSSPTVGIVEVTGTKNNIKYNVNTVESKPTKKMSLDDLTAAVNDTNQNPFDSKQVDQAKEEKQTCNTTTNRLAGFQRQRGPIKK